MRLAPTAPGGESEQSPGHFRWLRRADQERSVPLLVSLLILLATGAWLTERFESLAIFELLLTLVMLSSVRQLSASRRQALAGVLLAIPTITCLWLRKLVPAPGLSDVALGLLILFLLYTTATILLHIFRSKHITIDTLSESLSVYLLMGIAWGYIYGLIYLQLDQPARALAYFERALAVNPNLHQIRSAIEEIRRELRARGDETI